MAKRAAASLTSQAATVVKDIDSTYPQIYFYILRSQLRRQIDSLPWVEAEVAVSVGQAEHFELSQQVYSKLLQSVDQYIEETKDPYHSNLMRLARRDLVKNFQDRPVDLVQAMKECRIREQNCNIILNEPNVQSPLFDLCELHSEVPTDSVHQDTAEREMLTLERQVKVTRELIMNLRRRPEQKLDDLLPHVPETDNDCSNSMECQDIICKSFIVFQEQPTFKDSHSQNFEKCVESLEKLAELCKHFLHQYLISEKEAWLRQCTLASVCLAPKVDPEMPSRFCNRFAHILGTLLRWVKHPAATTNQIAGEEDTALIDALRQYEKNAASSQQQSNNESARPTQTGMFEIKLGKLVKDYVTNFTIISKQPPATVSVENNEKQAKNKKDSQSEESVSQKKQGSKQKKGPNLYDSKKKKPFDIQLKVPGGEYLHAVLALSGQPEYVFETELLEQGGGGEETSSTTAVAQCPLKGSLTFTPVPSSTPTSCELGLKDVRFQAFRRQDIKSEKEFIRIRIQVSVSVNEAVYPQQMYTLPFHVNTGSIQLLSMLGARMWYFYSIASPGKFGSEFAIPTLMPVKDFIDMLNLRLKHLYHGGRTLRPEEIKFILSRLPEKRKKIDLHDFLKIERQAQPANNISMYSFFAWFHAIACTVEDLLEKPWKDGVIYGIVGEDEAKKVLESAKLGDFLLRPSRDRLAGTSTARPWVYLAMNVKNTIRESDTNNDVVKVQAVPVKAEEIDQYGLHSVTIGQCHQGQPIGLRVVRAHKDPLSVDRLRRYPRNSKQKQFEHRAYQVKSEKREITELKFYSKNYRSSSGATSTTGFSKGNGPPDSGKKPRKPASRKKSVSSTLSSEEMEDTDIPSQSPPSYENVCSEKANFTCDMR